MHYPHLVLFYSRTERIILRVCNLTLASAGASRARSRPLHSSVALARLRFTIASKRPKTSAHADLERERAPRIAFNRFRVTAHFARRLGNVMAHHCCLVLRNGMDACMHMHACRVSADCAGS